MQVNCPKAKRNGGTEELKKPAGAKEKDVKDKRKFKKKKGGSGNIATGDIATGGAFCATSTSSTTARGPRVRGPKAPRACKGGLLLSIFIGMAFVASCAADAVAYAAGVKMSDLSAISAYGIGDTACNKNVGGEKTVKAFIDQLPALFKRKVKWSSFPPVGTTR